MPKRERIIKVKDYGDDWINRLAVVTTTFEKMSEEERGATLRFIRAKYEKST
jgi:hypothetical protein